MITIAESKADLVLHPIRMRIIQCLATGQRLTTQQLSDHLSDVPQASLYRHLNKLLTGGVVEVVEQHQVRGAMEKVYSIPQGKAVVTQEDLAAVTSEDHLRYFMTFLMKLLGDFERYLGNGDVDLLRDGVGYRQVELQLSDQELMEMTQKLSGVVLEYLGRPAAEDSKPRIFSTVVMPNVDGLPNKER